MMRLFPQTPGRDTIGFGFGFDACDLLAFLPMNGAPEQHLAYDAYDAACRVL